MLKIKIVRNNEEHYNDLVVLHNGKEIRRYNDCMESEDAVFHRDLSWVVEAILEAYELGKKESMHKEEKDGI